MDNEFRKDLNEQTLAILGQILEKKQGTIVACIIKDEHGNASAMLGYNVQAIEFIKAYKEALESLLAALEKHKKDTPKN